MKSHSTDIDFINIFNKHAFLKQACQDLWPEMEPYTEYHSHQSGEIGDSFESETRFYVFSIQGKINIFKGDQKIGTLGANQIYCWAFIKPGHVQNIYFETALPSEWISLTFPNTTLALITEAHLLSRLLNWFAFLPEPGEQNMEADDNLISLVQKYKHTQTHLFSIFNHDLRSPVASLISLLDLCQNEAKEENWGMVQQLLEDMRELADVHLRMLENLKHWAELRAGRKKPMLRGVFLQNVIDSAKVLILPSYQKKELELQINHYYPDLKIITDKDFAVSIFVEVLRNACKFSYRKQQVVVEIEKWQDRVAVHVIDQGKGFRLQMIETIFIPGKNKIDYGTENEPGTGLGLLIVKEMADLVGVELKIESEPGKGSNFTMYFPLAE
ncbi:MAG: sensor histidine kinase [Bacteroidales bacterium]